MLKLKYFIVIIIMFISFSCYSQAIPGYSGKLKKQFEKARLLYINKDYLLSIDVIDKLIKKEPFYSEAYLLKADVLHEMKKIKEEINCLEKAIQLDSLKYPKVYYFLGTAQLSIGEYAKAKKAFVKFVEKSGNIPGLVQNAKREIVRCEFAIKQLNKAFDINPESLGDSINTKFDEYWPSLSLDGTTLVFTRLVPFVDSINGRKFDQEDFYISFLKEGKWTKAKPISSLNTANNEGAQAISPDVGLLFFTACSRRDTWGGCDIYFSKKIQEGWSIPYNAGKKVNSTGWESQPSVSANNEYLYFVSNRKGGKGGMDIWRCRLHGFNNEIPQWGKAENLGDSINTPGNEMSPFIHPDGETLYFTSNYWTGMGGNDLFFSKIKADSTWSEPVNLGYPINTYHDERGLVVDASGERAFFSSDKTGQGMDIYSFEMPEKIRPFPVTYVQGSVVDDKSKSCLSANIEMIDLERPEKSIKMQTDEEGVFFVGLTLGRKYMMNVSSPGYLFYSEYFGLDDLRKAYDPFFLEVHLKQIEPGAGVILRNIFFETGSYELLPESITEMDKLFTFIEQNQGIKIEIGGHTDNIGGEQFNHELSDKRAKQVYDFLRQKGISASRLSYKGYGYSCPVQTNDTEEGRAANRRTEFRIVE